MTNLEIAWFLDEIADLLEIKGENIYKIRSYRKAARIAKNFTGDLSMMARNNLLETIPGIGSGIAKKITELVVNGESSYLKELRKEVPPGLREMLKIPGLGPRSVGVIFKVLGITTLEELEKAARERKIRKLPRMGGKTEQAIFRGLELLRGSFGKIPLGVALPVAEFFKESLEGLKKVEKIAIAGSARRGKEVVGNVDLVVAAEESDAIMDVFARNPHVKEVLAIGPTKSSIITWSGVQVDLRVVHRDSFYSALQYLTGSEAHNVILRGYGRKKGLKLNEYGIFSNKDGNEKRLKIASEEDIYRLLDMQYIPPELREGKNEIKLALNYKLPRLIERGDIKGDLHLHSSWSDGINSIEELVEAARNEGYKYIAITDHSKSLKIAGGLPVKTLLKQRETIINLNKHLRDIKILSGIEVDILGDGTLDYTDDILSKMDIVIASIHSQTRQDISEMTKRVIKAMQNPHVDIIAHPTGRLLGRREPLAIDIEKIIETAAATNTALEINASSERLDLKDEYAAMASQAGVMLAINTDAHDVHNFSDINYGLMVARRAGLQKKDILNCMDYEELLDWLR